MHKKMIKTVLDKLPPLIEKYSSEEKVLLDEFVEILKNFEQAEVKRTELVNNYDNYTQKLLGSKKYLHTPFLWFTVAYIQKVKLTLNWDNFQAESYYEYLAKFLRKDKSYHGVFELIRKQTALTDIKWEQLQYASIKMLKPLTEEQIRIIKGNFSIIKRLGIYALDPRTIKKELSLMFPKGKKIDKFLSAFFENLESQWSLNFHSPAFGIERFFVHIKGSRVTIDDIINFQDDKNTVLCLSEIYSVRGNPDEYLGILDVPKQDINLLTDFLRENEQKSTFELKEIAHIKTSFRGFSLERYSANEGWQKIGRLEFGKFKRRIEEGKEARDDLLTYLPQNINQNWQLSQHQLPIELIQIYSNNQTSLRYSELNLNILDKREGKKLSKSKIGLLKQLLYNKILYIDWIPWRLVFEFSLDLFLIKTSIKDLTTVKQLLKIVPMATFYVSDKEIYVWTYLTNEIVQLIEKEFKWRIYPISRFLPSQKPNYKWFDKEELRWKTPKVLLNKKRKKLLVE